MEPDATNRYLVGMHGEDVVILRPPLRGEHLTRSDALNLAAYLVALADPAQEEFAAMLKAVLNA